MIRMNNDLKSKLLLDLQVVKKGDFDLKEITNKFKNILIKFNYSINNKERTITLNNKEIIIENQLDYFLYIFDSRLNKDDIELLKNEIFNCF
jgi:hypothetical protein